MFLFPSFIHDGLMCLVLMNSTTILIALICSLVLTVGFSEFEMSIISLKIVSTKLM